MGLTRDEIINLALNYTSPEEITDFPFEGDVFCLLMRVIPIEETQKEEEGWAFRGYGICIGYLADEQSKPAGKWLWMHFASLDSFPPNAQVLKLQPPHVVKGRFQNAERTHEIRILKVTIGKSMETLEKSVPKPAEKNQNSNQPETVEAGSTKIVQFRKKKS
jgi:hypothetical protein